MGAKDPTLDIFMGSHLPVFEIQCLSGVHDWAKLTDC